MKATHPKYSRIIRHLWLLHSLLLRLLLNPQILDITSTKDNIFIDVVRGRDLIFGVATLCAKGLDLLEGDGGVFGADFVKGADVAMEVLAYGCSQWWVSEVELTECLALR